MKKRVNRHLNTKNLLHQIKIEVEVIIQVNQDKNSSITLRKDRVCPKEDI
jgi:hypothetical protein